MWFWKIQYPQDKYQALQINQMEENMNLQKKSADLDNQLKAIQIDQLKINLEIQKIQINQSEETLHIQKQNVSLDIELKNYRSPSQKKSWIFNKKMLT